jgi:hypothetical protein
MNRWSNWGFDGLWKVYPEGFIGMENMNADVDVKLFSIDFEHRVFCTATPKRDLPWSKYGTSILGGVSNLNILGTCSNRTVETQGRKHSDSDA